MPAEPQIDLLPYHKRKRFFWFLCLVFVVSLPALIFYTTGYRFDFTDDETMIVTTGGIYISVDDPEATVYLNEEPVQDRRLFQQAFYIQNVQSGLHRLVVQRPQAETWVKDVAVSPYLVTEVAPFNVPLQPRVRFITPTTTATGMAVFATTSVVMDYATSVEPFVFATNTDSVAYRSNEEYGFVVSLFTATSSRRTTFLERLESDLERFTFSSLATNTPAVATATTTVVTDDLMLYEREGELYVTWQGTNDNQIPFYFCVEYHDLDTTTDWYGEHVTQAIADLMARGTTVQAGTFCRDTIRIDRKNQTIHFFDFVPGHDHLVLLHLEDGLYVSEVDDRAWQNTQMLYEGTDIEVVVEGGQVFVREGETVFEIFLTLEE